MKEQAATLDEIFNLIRSGKRTEGVALLYSLHYNKLYGIAFLFVKNETEAEDIVHNAIYKLLNLELDLFPKDHVSTWLYTFVKNEALMFLRKEKSTISIDEIITVGKEDQKIENYVNMDAYYSMIKNLSEEQRQIVTLKVLGDYTHKEIAQMLGKPIGTIQWIYNISIKKLKYILSSMILAVLSFGIGFVSRLYAYVSDKTSNSAPQQPGITVPETPFDYWIMVLGGLLLIGIIGIIIFLKKSEKIPTKAHKKSI